MNCVSKSKKTTSPPPPPPFISPFPPHTPPTTPVTLTIPLKAKKRGRGGAGKKGPTSKEILRGVGGEANAGEVCAIMGPTGACTNSFHLRLKNITKSVPSWGRRVRALR